MSIHLRWIQDTNILGGETMQIRKHHWGKSHVETLPTKSLSMNSSGFSELWQQKYVVAAMVCHNRLQQFQRYHSMPFGVQSLESCRISKVHLVRILAAEASKFAYWCLSTCHSANNIDTGWFNMYIIHWQFIPAFTCDFYFSTSQYF